MANLSEFYSQRFLEILGPHSPEGGNKWGLGAGSDDLFGYISSQLPPTKVTEALSAEVNGNGGILGITD